MAVDWSPRQRTTVRSRPRKQDWPLMSLMVGVVWSLVFLAFDPREKKRAPAVKRWLLSSLGLDPAATSVCPCWSVAGWQWTAEHPVAGREGWNCHASIELYHKTWIVIRKTAQVQCNLNNQQDNCSLESQGSKNRDTTAWGNNWQRHDATQAMKPSNSITKTEITHCMAAVDHKSLQFKVSDDNTTD